MFGNHGYIITNSSKKLHTTESIVLLSSFELQMSQVSPA